LKRDAIDFHEVADSHVAIHLRLVNWARWCNGSGAPSTSPMFRLYIASARARSGDGVTYGGGSIVDTQDASKIARAVVALPEKHRAAINWAYVKPINPRRAAASIGTTLEGLALLVRDARQMLVNRKA
jgi:DNA-directed RNA polymerase specialized sigma24 family protein